MFLSCVTWCLDFQVADDMAYRRQKGAPVSSARPAQGVVTYNTSVFTTATAHDRYHTRPTPHTHFDSFVRPRKKLTSTGHEQFSILESPRSRQTDACCCSARRAAPDALFDAAVQRKQRDSSAPRSSGAASDVSATSPPLVPNRVSTDYLEVSAPV